MTAGPASALGPGSFRRIVDVPFQTCIAALDPGQRTRQGGGLRFGDSLLRGPVEHDRGAGTCRIQVALARGPLRPRRRMRLDIDRWSASSTALELIPCGPVRATAAYFRAGHFLLDSLTRSLLQRSSLPRPGPGHCQPATPDPRLQASLTPPATAFGTAEP